MFSDDLCVFAGLFETGFVEGDELAYGLGDPCRAVGFAEVVALYVFADAEEVFVVLQLGGGIGDCAVVGVFVFCAVPEVEGDVAFVIQRVQPLVVLGQGDGGRRWLCSSASRG